MESIFCCGILSRCVQHSPTRNTDEAENLTEAELDGEKKTAEVKDNEKQQNETKQYVTEIKELEEKLRQSTAKIKELEETLEETVKQNAVLLKDRDESAKHNATTLNELQTTANKQLEASKAKIESLEKGKDQLKRIVHNLEWRLYPKDTIGYADAPNLAHTLKIESTQANQDAKKDKVDRPALNGIAVLYKELFVVNDDNSTIQVFDSETFKFQRNFTVKNMKRPLDIASSKAIKCLYIISRPADEGKSEIFRISVEVEDLKSWSTEGGDGRLSTYESNVIVCLLKELKIYEYTPNGEIITTVPLSPSAGFTTPWHAIKVTHIHFVVSHGDAKDALRRVCVVDKEGKVIKVCDTWEKKSQHSNAELSVPICLLEDRNKCILVADRDHARILLLSSVLKYQRKLLDWEKGSPDVPVRLCFDETGNRLFVAANRHSSRTGRWKDGLIHIFNTNLSCAV